MQEQDRDPIVAICLLAALADGDRSSQEQVEFQRIADRLGVGDDSALTARANQGSLSVREVAAGLGSPEARKNAYEMAAAVIYADGSINPAERTFLAELRGVLELPDNGIEPMHRELETLALAPLAGPLPDTTAGTAMGGTPRPDRPGMPVLSREAKLDELIRKQALLTGALELLPQNLASLAIIPLQMRLVYRIGAEYGHTLDPEQVKDLFGAMGIGAAAQVLDGLARRILGGLGRGLFGRTLGTVVGGTAGMAAGAGVSFATTYALGYAARQYYAQGRRLSREDLQALFHRFRAEAEVLLPRVNEEIHQQAQHLDLKRVLASIQGAVA